MSGLTITRYKRYFGLESLYETEQERTDSTSFQFEAAQAEYDGDWKDENRRR